MPLIKLKGVPAALFMAVCVDLIPSVSEMGANNIVIKTK